MVATQENEPQRTSVERTSDREVVVKRTFDAPARLVFEAWSNPELFKRWWVPRSMGMTLRACEMDVRTGGGYRLVFGDDPANTMAYQAIARKMYGGCRVNAAIKIWVQKNKHGNGIRCDLVAVQFLRDDVPFGEGAVDVTGMFGQVAPQAGPSAAGMQAPAMPGFMGGFAPAPAAPAMPAPPFGAPAPVGLPSFFGR